MNRKIKTTFFVTKSTRVIAEEIVKETGIKYNTFQQEMIKDFIKGKHKIDYRLKITKRNDPLYVVKKCKEQIELDEETNEKINEIARKKKVTKTTILFQAMLDFCSKWSNKLWTEEEFKNHFIIKEDWEI